MFVLRDARIDDLDRVYEVARHLDTVNLPADREFLERLLQRSQAAFSAALPEWEREFLFVLVDPTDDKIVGTSMIHAKHGTSRSPHTFFEIVTDERCSETLDRYVTHDALRLGCDRDGPTEIGGLVLLPEYRQGPLRLGTLLSYGRFVYIGAHRQVFADRILSELLPELEPDGTSRLWPYLGGPFTGLSYGEADRLSRSNKEFIRGLFPETPLYLCMLPREVRDLIGVVGSKSRGVERLLRRIGFQFANRIDPFNGGPHFVARTDDVTLLHTLRSAKVRPADGPELDRSELDAAPWGIVAVERAHSPYFVQVGTRYRLVDDVVELPGQTCRQLGVAGGQSVWLQPIPAAARDAQAKPPQSHLAPASTSPSQACA
jgi:arginine N-succinyltransferase